MIEITMLELTLLIWAAIATALAVHFRVESNHRGKLLIGAAEFTKKLALDDKFRDELRETFKKSEVRFE